MSEQPKDGQAAGGGEVPAFRIPKKKVDESWKEEVRKEREALKEAAPAPGGPKSAAPGGKPAARPAADAAARAEADETEADESGAQPNRIFLNLIASLAQQALMQLGQMENPFSGRREVDLEGARQTIDLLDALKEKTRGNLAELEERTLTDAARELQFHYVEIARKVAAQMKARGQGRPPGA
ncbi:MAG: DUF1844 domain-containing protein [Planctomycetota bacterium]|nr:DUF1844 domain-containing protein [Planctomycetota bacterium]